MSTIQDKDEITENYTSKDEDNFLLRLLNTPFLNTMLFRYNFALGVVLVAFLIKLGLNILFQTQNRDTTPFLTFYLAIIIAAIFAGLGPGLLATFFSAALASYFFIIPIYTFEFSNIATFVNVVIFCLNCSIITLICNWLRKSVLNVQKEVEKRKELTEASRARLAYLAEASEVLASSLDYATTLQNIATLAVPTIADWCSIYLPDTNFDGEIKQVALAHINPVKEKLAVTLREYQPLRQNETSGVAEVLRTGKSQLVPVITDGMLQAEALDQHHLKILRDLELSSSMIVAMQVRDQIIGAIAFAATRPDRHFNKTDLAMAEELARRAAVAIDNASLYSKAQEAIAARDEFLSVAAHELRTPVTAMRGYAQLLNRQLDRPEGVDYTRVQKALDSIDEQSAKLSRLINRLLDVSRVEAGKLILEPEETDIVALLRTITTNFQSSTTNHTIVVDAPDSLSALIDPLKFEQVLINLLDNAVKYSPDGGQIEVVLKLEAVMICLSIKDQGIGVPPEKRDKIFNRFFQANEKGYFGMGLGLYVSNQIVELHGGKIEAEFPPEGGSIFIIRFPLKTSSSS